MSSQTWVTSFSICLSVLSRRSGQLRDHAKQLLGGRTDMMISRKRFLNLVAAAALSLGVGGAASAQEVTLTLHQFLPPQANVPKLILDVWADNVEEASEGRIKIDRFPSMQLGGRPPELMDQRLMVLPMWSGRSWAIRRAGFRRPKCLNCPS